MNKPNITSLQLKLNRNKLAFNYDKSTDILTLGGVQNLNSLKATNIFLPFVLGATLITTGIFTGSGILEPIGFICLLYGGYGITLVKKKKQNNSIQKIIKPRKIQINNGGFSATYTENDIQELKINIELITKETYEGTLSLKSGEHNHVILSFNEKKKNLLEEDLNYMKDYILLKLKKADNNG